MGQPEKKNVERRHGAKEEDAVCTRLMRLFTLTAPLHQHLDSVTSFLVERLDSSVRLFSSKPGLSFSRSPPHFFASS